MKIFILTFLILFLIFCVFGLLSIISEHCNIPLKLQEIIDGFENFLYKYGLIIVVSAFVVITLIIIIMVLVKC